MSSTRQPCCAQARQRLLCQSKGKTAKSRHETHVGLNQQTHCCDQSTGHMLCQNMRHTAVSNHETQYCIKPRRRCCDAYGRRQTLLLCHSATHHTVRALPSIEHRIHPRTQYPSSEKRALRAAAVSNHETGTVTKQTTGALHFMVAFALRGGVGDNTFGNISHFVVPWEAGVPSPLKPARLSRTPQNTVHRCCVKHETNLMCPSTTKATV